MAKLIINASKDGQPARSLELKQGANRLGRAPENDHVFDDSEVSSRHCDVLVDMDFVYVRDLDSTNGVFIDGDRVKESALYHGQTLRIGDVQMLLEAPPARVALPEPAKPENPGAKPASVMLDDGHPSCPSHETRHAVWECPHCLRIYCDECIRKLRRVGGPYLHLCPSCSNPCKFTAWSELMRKKKKGFFGKMVSKLTESIKRTTRQITR